jgi:chromosome segregation ATPase
MTSQVKSISNKLNDVSSKLDKVKGEITRLQVGIRNSDRDLAKSKDNLEALSLEIKGLEKEMTEANQTREQIKNDAQELTEKVITVERFKCMDNTD